MRTLAYNSGQVPSRYQVDRQSLRVDSQVVASGAFAEVREGRLGDMVVAVRTLLTGRQTDHREVQKVCITSDYSFRTDEAPCDLGFLQGMYHLDECLPS